MTDVTIEPFTPAHLEGLIARGAAEGLNEYADDVKRPHAALTAPGVTTLFAIAGGRLDGAIQVPSDDLI